MLLSISIVLIISGLLLLLVHFFRSYDPGKMIVGAPFGLGSYEFDRSSLSEKELDISWKIYVQLTTRKAAIPFDEENDIISEVYDSWYELFKSTREYLLEIPGKDLINNDNAQHIVDLSILVLNDGLRPHLTEWQGKYRKWYDNEVNNPENKNLTPQQIQRKYPHYHEMVAEIKDVNKELIRYAEQLKRFSHEEPASFSTKLVSTFREVKAILK